MRRLLKWIFPARYKVVLIHRTPSTLTSEEWRADDELVKAARGITRNATFMEMMDVLRSCCYVNYQMTMGTPISERAMMQARGEGYLSCINDLIALGEPAKPKIELEATFEEQET